jgi:hypothetical protein
MESISASLNLLDVLLLRDRAKAMDGQILCKIKEGALGLGVDLEGSL